MPRFLHFSASIVHILYLSATLFPGSMVAVPTVGKTMSLTEYNPLSISADVSIYTASLVNDVRVRAEKLL